MSEDVRGFIPKDVHSGGTANVSRDVSGVQAGAVGGSITVNNWREGGDEELLVRRVAVSEIDEVRNQFVRPHGYPEALDCLRRNNVVVVWGRDSGRSVAARALLTDCGVGAVVEWNPHRGLDTVRQSDLTEGEGYIWDARDGGDRLFTDSALAQCTNLLKTTRCRLVIVVDTHSQCSQDGSSKAVRLYAPDPAEVAVAALWHRHREPDVDAELTLKRDLAHTLKVGDRPEKAMRAADFAHAVSRGDLDLDGVLARLNEDIGNEVDRWFEEWTELEYAMALAVAVLENSPYCEVVQHAHDLDEQIRAAQIPEDKALRPRKVFDKPKEELIRDTRTMVVECGHPKHLGLRFETIRFEREGWASAVLCHVWREYARVKPVLQNWLRTQVSPAAAKQALCTIIAKVPAHEPLAFINELADAPAMSDRFLAEQTMAGLAHHHDLFPLVKETLERWVVSGGARRKATAAGVYSSPLGLRDIDDALHQLGRIGTSSRRTPQEAVIEGVLWMLRHRDYRDQVIRSVVEWAEPRHRRTGLRVVSLSIALWLAGVVASENIDVDEIARSHPGEVRTLMLAVLSDREFGSHAIDRLGDLAVRAPWDTDAAAELVRLAELIIPDLRWWSRRARVAELALRHPDRRTMVRRVFRAARKHQRRMARSHPV